MICIERSRVQFEAWHKSVPSDDFESLMEVSSTDAKIPADGLRVGMDAA